MTRNSEFQSSQKANLGQNARLDQNSGAARRQIGATLIEAAIASIISAIALIALLQSALRTTRTVENSHLATIAQVLLADGVDRLLASGLTGDSPIAASTWASLQANRCENLDQCELPSVMQNELNAWTTQVATLLPGGTGSMRWSQSVPNALGIDVRWYWLGQQQIASRSFTLSAL